MVPFIMVLVRIAAFIEVMLGALGMLWFGDYYFSRANALDLAIAIVPLLGLFVAIVTPASVLIRKHVYLGSQLLFAAGVMCVAVTMYRDLHLPNAPDFAAFEARFIPLALLCVFMLHIFWQKDKNRAKQA